MAILLTAFDTYDQWTENSSWLAMTEYLREHGGTNDIVTRRYPVDLHKMKERLEIDLARGVDGVIHFGQRPGGRQLELEAICLNVAGFTQGAGREFGSIIDDGPVAFRSNCPLGLWAEHLRRQNVPAEVSYHAGTYLCNAIMYLSHYWLRSRSIMTPVAFVHVPLTTEQAKQAAASSPGMSVETSAAGVRILADLMRRTVATTSIV